MIDINRYRIYNKCLFVLGASDPEMNEIEKILRKCNIKNIVYASIDGRRVLPYEAYKFRFDFNKYLDNSIDEIEFIECKPINIDELEYINNDRLFNDINTIFVNYFDHHNKGDRGFRMSPENYWLGSSIGQTLSYINYIFEDINEENYIRHIAAADHCLAAAYSGKCPGIDKDYLLKIRLINKALYEKVDVIDVYSGFIKTINEITNCKKKCENIEYYDITNKELKYANEVQAYLGINIIYNMVDKTGNVKYGCMGDFDFITLAMNKILPNLGCKNIYGNPHRGFCGGYVEK